ncbi:MAG: NAD(+) synthetase [Chloroflexi bacterium]|nr:NAD(+) synthetase [Chloroflexota bacterium]
MRGLQLDPALVTRVLQGFVRDEIGKFGINRAVVALSGGIDSALSCALAVRALGSDSVLAVLMPYRTSNPASRSDAETLVRQLNIASVLIDISPAVDGITDQLHDKPSDLRRGNVMARTRMTALYDQSESFGGLVVGTSNKTELLLGYGTQHGDMASAVNPIGDLYKTQVQTLSEALDIPKAILEKTPSADLWEGQSDEDELGFDYELADQVLYLLIDEQFTADDLVSDGYDSAIVNNVLHRIEASQFKRRLPVIAKLSHRTIDRDFRYPRDWGR